MFNICSSLTEKADHFVASLKASQRQRSIPVGLDLTKCKQTKQHEYFISDNLLGHTWALMSAPVSSNSLTAEPCPFMAANISGDIPSLLPVLHTIQL